MHGDKQSSTILQGVLLRAWRQAEQHHTAGCAVACMETLRAAPYCRVCCCVHGDTQSSTILQGVLLRAWRHSEQHHTAGCAVACMETRKAAPYCRVCCCMHGDTQSSTILPADGRSRIFCSARVTHIDSCNSVCCSMLRKAQRLTCLRVKGC